MSKFIYSDQKELSLLLYIHYLLIGVMFIASIFRRVIEKDLLTLSFGVELVILFVITRYLVQSIKERNFAYWTILFLVLIFMLQILFHYSIVDFNLSAIYLSLLGVILIGINSYLFSAPIYFPRVQWWEYDFRYRGDLKGVLLENNSKYKIRMIDLRRQQCAFESFQRLQPNQEVMIQVWFEGKEYTISGNVKTIYQEIPGRQYRYGLAIEGGKDYFKTNYLDLQREWRQSKRVKIRRKFENS